MFVQKHRASNALRISKTLQAFVLLAASFAFLHDYAAGSEATLRERIAFCANNLDDTDRLRCFDMLSSDTDTLRPTLDQQSDLITWHVDESISPIDSNPSIKIYMDATKMLSETDSLPKFWIVCDQDATSIYFDYNWLFDEEDHTWNVGVRIDENTLELYEMKISSNHKWIGFWGGRSSIPFIRKLIGANQLVVILYPDEMSDQVSIFPLNGLDNAIVPIQSACHWG